MSQRLLVLLAILLPLLAACGGGGGGGGGSTGDTAATAGDTTTTPSPGTGTSTTSTPGTGTSTASTPATGTSTTSTPASTSTTTTALQPGIAVLAGALGGPGNIDGTGADARFADPAGISVDAAGNLYVAGDNTIRSITPQRAVRTLAGVSAIGTRLPGGLGQNTGTQPNPSDSFADGTASQARLSTHRLAADRAGDTFFTQASAVRKMTPDGTVSTVAGTASDAQIVDGPVATARFRQPDGIAIDGSGDLYVTDAGTLREISATGTVSTIVGSATVTFSGGLAADAAGDVYATNGTRIFQVTPQGAVTAYAGSGTAGAIDGPGTQAQFRRITDIALAPDGSLYVIDDTSIRKVAPDRTVSTVVPAAPAGVVRPRQAFAGITVAPDGSVYVTNAGETVVEKVAPDGTRTAWAGRATALQAADGTGSAASFGVVTAIATDAQGNAYVLDAAGKSIRKIAPDGTTTTLLAASASGFNGATGLAPDDAGGLVVADTFNHAIRTVGAGGTVATLAGVPGSPGYADGPGSQALFNSPHGVAVDASRNAYVADTLNDVIRKITPDGTVSTLAGSAGQTGSTDGTGSAARFFPPMQLFLDPAGNLLESSAGSALRRITPQGAVSTVAPAGATLDQQTTWYAADAAGNVYGADLRGLTLRKLAPDGSITTVAGTAGSVGVRTGALPGSFGPIVGIAVLPPLPNTVGTRLLVLSENSVLLVTLPG